MILEQQIKLANKYLKPISTFSAQFQKRQVSWKLTQEVSNIAMEEPMLLIVFYFTFINTMKMNNARALIFFELMLINFLIMFF